MATVLAVRPCITCMTCRCLIRRNQVQRNLALWTRIHPESKLQHRYKHVELFPQRLSLPESHGYVPTLSPPQVTSLLCGNEVQVKNEPGKNSVKAFESNQLASNHPIEDRRAVASLFHTGGSLFGLYDGHGGATCAQFISERLLEYVGVSLLSLEDLERFHHAMKTDQPMDLLDKYVFSNDYVSEDMLGLFRNSLHRYVVENLSFLDDFEEELSSTTKVMRAMRSAFVRLDNDISVEAMPSGGALNIESLGAGLSGACGCVAYINDADLFVSNLGDTRAVIGQKEEDGKWVPLAMTADHNAENEDEVARLRAAHPSGESSSLLPNKRLLGYLIPLRAFGDMSFKWSARELQALAVALGKSHSKNVLLKHYYTPPYLINEPEIRHHKLTSKDAFLVLASDGLWDMCSNEEVVALVGAHLEGRLTPNRFRLNKQPSRKLGSINSDLVKRKSGLAHKTIDDNSATHLIRHALGFEHRKVSEMLTFPPEISRYYRDDITITVIFFDRDYIANLP